MRDLIDSFVAAYTSRVVARCQELGVAPPEAAIRQGETWLRQALTDLLARPFSEQRRGPLELFQEAMVFPTRALVEDGLQPVARSEVPATALPGDLFDLAPASSSELGEDAWHAHLRWGAAKARALAGDDPDDG